MFGDDSMFDERLAALARHVPGEQAGRSALEATRRAVLESRAARHRKRRFWMRMTIPSGIAAAVIGAAVFMTWMPGTPRASAADQLDQAVQATRAYRGWVHWSQSYENPGTRPATSVAPRIKKSTHHVDLTNGIVCDVIELEDDLQIQMVWTGKHEMASYSRNNGEVHLTSLTEDESRALQTMAPPLTVGDILAQIKEHVGREPLSVKETPDGDSVRFDVVLFASADDAEKFRASSGKRTFIGTGFSVWVNHDKLITRMRMEAPSGDGRAVGRVDIDVSYGLPEIRDIYDLGAPQAAKLVDQRIGNIAGPGVSPDMAKLLARMDERRAKGFGDCVALLSSYVADSMGQRVETKSGNVTLYASQGDKRLMNQYLLFLPRGLELRSKPILREVPEGWPAPDVQKLLPVLRNAGGQLYFIMNGDHGWYGSLDSATSLRVLSAEKDKALINSAQTLVPYLWPAGLASADLDTKVLDGGTIRVRNKGVIKYPEGGDGNFETTYVLDPAKDDLPVESIRYESRTDLPGPPFLQTRVHFTSFAQLADGQWYPTEWHSENINRDLKTGDDVGMTQIFHLQIIPGLKLDDGWFTDPRGPVPTAPGQ